MGNDISNGGFRKLTLPAFAIDRYVFNSLEHRYYKNDLIVDYSARIH